MSSLNHLDRLLAAMDIAVQNLAFRRIERGQRRAGLTVDGVTVHCVLSGTMHMALPGQQPIICGPGSVVLVPKGLEPSLAAEAGPAIYMKNVEQASLTRGGLGVPNAADRRRAELRIITGLIVTRLPGPLGLFDGLQSPFAEDLSDLPLARHAYAIMHEEIAEPGFATGALTCSLMKTCLLIVIRRFFSRRGIDEVLLGALADRRLGSAVAAALEDPSAPHSVASLAGEAGMSRSSFARNFNDAFAISPMEFVSKTRLHQAADLLHSTDLPVKAIAATIGFASRSHFSRAFRDAYGSDPSEFRKLGRSSASDQSSPTRDAPARAGALSAVEAAAA